MICDALDTRSSTHTLSPALCLSLAHNLATLNSLSLSESTHVNASVTQPTLCSKHKEMLQAQV